MSGRSRTGKAGARSGLPSRGEHRFVAAGSARRVQREPSQSERVARSCTPATRVAAQRAQDEGGQAVRLTADGAVRACTAWSSRVRALIPAGQGRHEGVDPWAKLPGRQFRGRDRPARRPHPRPTAPAVSAPQWTGAVLSFWPPSRR